MAAGTSKIQACSSRLRRREGFPPVDSSVIVCSEPSIAQVSATLPDTLPWVGDSLPANTSTIVSVVALAAAEGAELPPAPLANTR